MIRLLKAKKMCPSAVSVSPYYGCSELGKGEYPRNRDGRGSFAGKSHCGSRMSSGASPSFCKNIISRGSMVVEQGSVHFLRRKENLPMRRREGQLP